MKKLFVFLTMSLLSICIGITAFAANTTSESDTTTSNNTQQILPFGRGNRNGGDFEEMKTQHEEMISKWDSLTDAQKEELYGMQDQIHKIDQQMIDKYVEYGVIDSDTAKTIKENMDAHSSSMRENNIMPGMMHKMGGPRGGKFHRQLPPENTQNQ